MALIPLLLPVGQLTQGLLLPVGAAAVAVAARLLRRLSVVLLLPVVAATQARLVRRRLLWFQRVLLTPVGRLYP